MGSSDIQVRKENLYDYPPLLAALQPWGMQYVIDAGSNDGFSTWLFATALENATVVALEASRYNFAMTHLNTQALRNVHSVHAALWNGSDLLQLAGQRLGNWGIQALPLVIKSRGARGERVVGVDVETLMRQACFPRIDFLKMDIEGAIT